MAREKPRFTKVRDGKFGKWKWRAGTHAQIFEPLPIALASQAALGLFTASM
jgi:hypothetical protein